MSNYPTQLCNLMASNLKVYTDLTVPLSHLLFFKVVCIINQALEIRYPLGGLVGLACKYS